jgi:hypothetical protein
MRIPIRLALCLSLAAPAAALGQTAPGAPPQLGQPVVPLPPGPATPGPVPPEHIQPPGEAAQPKGPTIVPPNVDPGINKVPPPAAGAPMPVIPPPGSPGSNSNVVPK